MGIKERGMKTIKIWGIHKKYKGLSWWENFMGGHLTIGAMTIYGSNAMAWSVNIQTKRWGYICFTLPAIHWHRKKFGYYFYVSPNGTPWASTYYLGRQKEERRLSKIRKARFGHNFDTNKHYDELRKINDSDVQFKLGVRDN